MPVESVDSADVTVWGVFSIVRFVIVVFCSAAVSMEAGYFAEAIQDILRGARFPLFEYQYMNLEGASLLLLAMGAALTASLGDAFWVLNLQGVLVSQALFICCYLDVKRIAGPTAALVAGLLLAVPFPAQAVVTSMPAWDWVPGALFTWLFLRELVELDGERAPSSAAKLRMGVLAGLGIWTHLSFIAVALAPCLMPRRWLGRVARQLASAWFCCGVLAGLAPWLVYNARNDWLGVKIFLGAMAGTSSWSSWIPERFQRAWDLLTTGIPLGFGFPGRMCDPRILAYLAYALLAVALVRLAREHLARPEDVAGARARLERLLLGFVAGYSALAIVSGLEIVVPIPGAEHPAWGVVHPWSTIHLFPLLPMFCILAALAGSNESEGKSALWLPVSLWLVCLAGVWQLPDRPIEHPGPLEPAAGSGRFPLGLAWRTGRDPELALKYREKLTEHERVLFSIGLGFAIAERPWRHEPVPPAEIAGSKLLERYLTVLDAEERAGLWMGIGRIAASSPDLAEHETEFLSRIPRDARLAVQAGFSLARTIDPERPLFDHLEKTSGMQKVAEKVGKAAVWAEESWKTRRPFWD